MTRRRLVFAIALLFLGVQPTVPAAAPRDTLVVSTDWLARHLQDTNLVLLHVGEQSEYDARHIPGARYVDRRQISVSDPNGLTLELPPPETLRTALAALGISDDSTVVVYYGSDWVSPATRVIFTLDYAGLDRVSLLDGGMPAWVRDGHDVTAAVPTHRTGTLSPLKVRQEVVDADFVRAHASAPGYVVIDSRDRAFFDGTQMGGPKDHRVAGHIAGARSVPFGSITTEDLKLKSPEALTTLFAAAGVKPNDTVVTYCHIGQQATAVLFAARTLGHRVLLYDGSFEDWARRGLPVEK